MCVRLCVCLHAYVDENLFQPIETILNKQKNQSKKNVVNSFNGWPELAGRWFKQIAIGYAKINFGKRFHYK